MPKLFTPLRQPSVLLLLGLLALLLWGQCAFHLNENGSSTAPSINLHLKTAVRVVHLDSLSTHMPDVCYITIALQNLSDKPCRLASLDCALWLDKQRLGYSFTSSARGTVLPARGEQVFQVAITPYETTDSHKGTDFGLLRAAWQQNRLARHRARLEVFYGYYPYEGTSQEANYRIQMVPLAK